METRFRRSSVKLRLSSRGRALGRPMSRDDVHGGVCAAGGVGAPRAEREVTHLAFHPARHDAAATGADRERVDFGEDRVTRHLQPTHGRRGNGRHMRQRAAGDLPRVREGQRVGITRTRQRAERGVQRSSGPATIKNRVHVQLVDPRAQQQLDFGAEGRGGQVARCWRSDLKIDGTTGAMVLDIRGAGKKLGRLLMLAPVQQALLAFNLEIGYLSEAEAAYRLSKDDPKSLADYPLFVGGKLVNVRTDSTRRRKRASRTANRTANTTTKTTPRWKTLAEKTLRDWHDDVETVLGIAHVRARGNNGWQRAFANLHDQWHAEPRVKEPITGHTTRSNEDHGSTRTDGYLNLRDTRLLREGQRLIKHARTVYVLTGEAPAEAERIFPTA